MSTLQPAHSHGLSPLLLLSPAAATNQFVIFDNSDQGSVDSDYTSLGSSKFYGNGGSTSSLHRQGRSQSIDELAATTTIPTRHFNGALNVNKLNNDPLQFVKIHPNHELIERAQEQLTLLESRKRLQETFKLSNHHRPTISSSNVNIAHAASTKTIDDETDWSKAVENWRQKREEKRKQSLKATRSDDDAPMSPPPVERSLSSPAHKATEPETKRKSSPPPTVASPAPPVVKPSAEQLEVPSRPPVKSPSPQRIRGPAKVHDIYIQKAVDVRGFGFKLDGGPAHNRAIYISTLEEGSPADRAGLCVDDEIVSMNDENIEHMTFDQVRKILKERNLRGSIKLVVKTYEDVVDENSQTITTEHSRTPSPQKPVSHSHPITSTSPAPASAPARTTPVSSTPPANVQAPIYTFLPYTPPPSSLTTPDAPANTPSQQTSISSLNVFGPKPFRLNASVQLDTQKTNETSTNQADEQQQQQRPPPPVGPKPPPPESVNTPPANPTLFTSELKHSLTSPTQPKTLPPPLTSVETLLQGTPIMSNQTPPRSFGEHQLSSPKQEHPVPYPRSPPSRDSRSVNVPIDMSTPHNNRVYNGRSDANETVLHYFDLSHQPGFSPSYPKRSMQDIPSMFVNPPPTNLSRLSSAHSSDRALNEIKPNQSVPTCNPPPKKSSMQLDEKKTAPQRVTNKQLHSTFSQLPKKAPHEEYSWTNHEQGKPTVPPPPAASALMNRNGKPLSAHRPPPPIPLEQESHMHAPTSKHLSMFHYGDTPDDLHYRPLRNAQHHRDSDPTGQRHLQFKSRPRSPVRTTISSNNNRVLSVSGKLHCSRCNEELGQGSAMVIESLGLYYHIECFRCFVCHAPLSSSFEGTDVRVRSNRLHCQNCFSDENGVRSSAV